VLDGGKYGLLVDPFDVAEGYEIDLGPVELSSLRLTSPTDALVLRDAETRVVDVNPAFLALSGYSRDEVVGTTLVVLVTSFVFAVYLWLADLVIVQLFKVIGS